MRKSIRWRVVVALLSLIAIAGCATAPEQQSLHRYEYGELHMASLFRIVLYAPDQAKADDAAVAAFERIEELNKVMSDYDPQSELMQLCAKPYGTTVKVSEDLFEILQESQRFWTASDGAFDVTVGPYVKLWREARKKKALPGPLEWAEAGLPIGFQKLKLDAKDRTVTLTVPNMKLDLGGIAKGFAADKALKILKRRGINRVMVAASGDIALGDAPPSHEGWAIGVSSIDGANQKVVKTVQLKNAGISTSGDTEQFIEIDGVRYSHVVNPVTGFGLTGRIQATVIGPNATTSDGLDNAVCVMGIERGMGMIESLPETAAMIVTADGSKRRVVISRRFSRIPLSTEPTGSKVVLEPGL